VPQPAGRVSRPLPGPVLAVALACGGWLPVPAVAAWPPPAPTVAECRGTDTAVLLRAAADPGREARAYWLDRRRLQWPAAPRAARFVLLASADGQLRRGGDRVHGADARIVLEADLGALPAALAERFRFIGAGPRLQLPLAQAERLPILLQGQVWLVAEDAQGHVLDATGLQLPGALDDRYAPAAQAIPLGAVVGPSGATFSLWAPTARDVALCLRRPGAGDDTLQSLQRDAASGSWSASVPGELRGAAYRYLVDVFVPGVGLVRNRVTDPYALTFDADSRHGIVADLDDPHLKPEGWDLAPSPHAGLAQTDMVIYELHVRDFSINDASVPEHLRGKYAAFTQAESLGMRHLRALAEAGLTDVHLLPVFDLATVPETGCVTPTVASDGPAGEAAQAAVMAVAAKDCFNWGYDPLHYNAPEGSYASDADDGAARVREFRAMVQALHRAGLRVGMDVVYNHTSASGQDARSVLDRIVPGYYHRLDAKGQVERSTCCANTATEHAMMARLMIDSVRLWATQYRIDSFRFDLMAHQPRAVMEALQRDVDAATGRHVNLIGEGWNFGEIANGARFVQASQLSLNGSGIGTFSDRGRDALRGGSAQDSGRDMFARQGYVNGLVYAQNAFAPARDIAELRKAADMVRVGLAGSLRDYRMATQDGRERALADIPYGDQPAGYVSQPGEVVNYIENHDNQTLYDINALKLPRGTPAAERARVQVLAMAINAFSQGVAYYHAGVDLLRSKSLDRNSYDSGDWFNRIDWSARDNYFGTGLPPKQDSGRDWDLLRPVLADASIKPAPGDIAFARDAFRDLLRIRASSRLFRLPDAKAIHARLRFENTGPAQDPLVLAAHLDGRGLEGAGFAELMYFVNVSPQARTLSLPEQRGKAWILHPVHRDPGAADRRPRESARVDPALGRFTVPARTALVYVVN
jgi:pullulanase